MSESLDLAELVASWQVHLRAARRSPNTIRAYLAAVRLYLRWCSENGHPAALDRAQVRAWCADQLEHQAPATVRLHLLGVQRFAKWLYEEGEAERDTLAGLEPPKLDVQVVPGLSEAQLRALLKACDGKDFTARRDTALIRLLIETGARAAEVTGMRLDDLDVANGTIHIRRGKGYKGRMVPFSAQAGAALDRYVRARRSNTGADSAMLWLGARGRPLGYDGLSRAIKARGKAAGIEGLHAHRLRNVAAMRWLAAGGSEAGLVSMAGWTSRQMIDRYAAATSSARAIAESRELGLGDL